MILPLLKRQLLNAKGKVIYKQGPKTLVIQQWSTKEHFTQITKRIKSIRYFEERLAKPAWEVGIDLK